MPIPDLRDLPAVDERRVVAYSVEKLYLLTRPKNLRPLQAAETIP